MAAIVETEIKFPEIYENSDYFDWWSFELSDWQKWSLKYLLDGKNVIVKAPTGSGKTLPADFSIKYYTKHKKKVIYCSPIKALTNEKYYTFKEKYPHISFGIITGDNTDNPEADVLCMTTTLMGKPALSLILSWNIAFCIEINVFTTLPLFLEAVFVWRPFFKQK